MGTVLVVLAATPERRRQESMVTFHEQGFDRRFGTLGDIAEDAFKAMMDETGSTWEEFGWRRPATGMMNMSQRLKNAPDFYTGKGWLVEVMGCGRDGILKGLKVPKWEALKFWHHEVQQVAFWVWNSSHQQGVWVPMEEMANLVDAAEVKAFENDGNEYYELPWEWLLQVGEVA